MTKKTTVGLIFAITLVVVGAIIIGYGLGKRVNRQSSNLKNETVAPSPSGPTDSTATSTLSSVSDGILPVEIARTISWNTPQKTKSLGLFANATDYNDKDLGYVYFIEQGSEYYKVGSFSYNNKPGVVYYVIAPSEGPSAPSGFMFVDYDGKLIYLSKYSDKITTSGDEIKQTTRGRIGKDGFLLDKFVVDPVFSISAFDFPATIVGPSPRQTLTLDTVQRSFFSNYYGIQSASGAKPVAGFTVPGIGQVYMSTSTNGFYLMPPGPLVAVYKLELDFYPKDSSVPQITFSDGSVNTTEYAYYTMGGCGSSDYAAAVPASVVNPATDLVTVGTTNQGDPIFALKNVNNSILTEAYKNFPTDPPQTYDQFIASRPFLYWKDPFGRLIKLSNVKYQPQAECGKPVIYLYPEKTTNVFVKLEPKGGFTYTEPLYNGGWNVVAKPNGQLTEISSGQQYPYLFWEGRGGLYQTPKQGWVVKKSNVASFLTQKLSELGLNQKESADFMEFWLPRILAASPSQRRGQGEVSSGSPYYFITFMGNSTMDNIAPLAVDPKPDTVIRILMDFTPLDKPISVEPFSIHTPERKGFTVVEWGGVLK